MSERRFRFAGIIFSTAFLLMSLALVTDSRTYLMPPTENEAKSTLAFWTQGLSEAHPASSYFQKEKEELVSYMSSPARFQIHRTLIFSLVVLYIFCILAFKRKSGNAFRLVSLTACFQILHGIFFLFMGYYGRRVSSEYFRQSSDVPWLVFGENEQFYLLGIAFAACCMVYALVLDRHRLNIIGSR